jgi:2-polyprenyl-3-methyl-5-hydroxy-6-metoxy-1,4-benzoquinol methylase
MTTAAEVVWHDAECGSYHADLPLWRELATAHGDPVLDVGAGTGRVTLDLAAYGYRVTALDRDAVLLAELARRAQDSPVEILHADARSFSTTTRFKLVIVPMQTVQLLDSVEDRAAFMRVAAAHLSPGGRIAAALADPFEGFDDEHAYPPAPDVVRQNGVTYASQPVALRR